MQAPRELRALQRAFDKFIEKGESIDLSPFVANLPCITREKSFEIYRNNYISSLLQSLSDTYSACEALLGEEIFRSICLNYSIGERSKSSILSNYGERFSTFLATLPLSSEIPFIPELADYEWNLKNIILSEFDKLTSHDSSRFILKQQKIALVDHAIVFDSQFPISELWQSLTSMQEIDIPEGDRFFYLMFKNSHGSSTLSISKDLYVVLSQPGQDFQSLLSEKSLLELVKLSVLKVL